MKAWILATLVVAALVLVGVPAVALTVASDDGGSSRSAAPEPKRHQRMGPDEGPKMWQHGQGWGRPGMRPGKRPGMGHHPFRMHKLSAKQRAALAERLDQRAAQLRKAATCLRGEGDAAKCFERSFSRPPRRG